MSANPWHHRVLHAEGPNGTAAERTIERTAIQATGLSIYQLARTGRP